MDLKLLSGILVSDKYDDGVTKIWKLNLVPSVGSSSLFDSCESETLEFIEVYYETMDWYLSNNNIHLKEVTFLDKSCYIIEYIEEGINKIYPTLEDALSNVKHLKITVDLLQITFKCLILYRYHQHDKLHLIYEQVEYPDGDLYSLIIAISNYPCPKNEFMDLCHQVLDKLSLSRSIFYQWTDRYHRDKFNFSKQPLFSLHLPHYHYLSPFNKIYQHYSSFFSDDGFLHNNVDKDAFEQADRKLNEYWFKACAREERRTIEEHMAEAILSDKRIQEMADNEVRSDSDSDEVRSDLDSD